MAAVAASDAETSFTLTDPFWQEKFGLCSLKRHHHVFDYGLLIRNTPQLSQCGLFESPSADNYNVILLIDGHIDIKDVTTVEFNGISINLTECQVAEVYKVIPCEHHPCPYEISIRMICLNIDKPWKENLLSMPSLTRLASVPSNHMDHLVYFRNYPLDECTTQFCYIRDYPPSYPFVPLYICIGRNGDEHMLYGVCVCDSKAVDCCMHLATFKLLLIKDSEHFDDFTKHRDRGECDQAVTSMTCYKNESTKEDMYGKIIQLQHEKDRLTNQVASLEKENTIQINQIMYLQSQFPEPSTNYEGEGQPGYPVQASADTLNIQYQFSSYVCQPLTNDIPININDINYQPFHQNITATINSTEDVN
jgi:hypothetical protein